MDVAYCLEKDCSVSCKIPGYSLHDIVSTSTSNKSMIHFFSLFMYLDFKCLFNSGCAKNYKQQKHNVKENNTY